MEKQEFYRTDNFYLACYLLTRGLEFNGVEGEGKSKVFIFYESPEREMFERQFLSRKNCEVDIWSFITALKVVRSSMYDINQNKKQDNGKRPSKD